MAPHGENFVSLCRVIRYLVAVYRCFAWDPPTGLHHTVTISPRWESLSVNLIEPGGLVVTMSVDPFLSSGRIQRDLDKMAWVLMWELGRQRASIGQEDPELVWD